MNKNLVIALVVIVSVLVVGGVVFAVVKNNPAKPAVSPVVEVPNPTPTPEAVEPDVVSATKEFTVTASNFKFDLKTIKVKKGDTVKITFKNVEGFHDFVIDEFDVATNQIGVEEEDEVEFVADKAGSFEYYCSVGQHRKNGMVGKLVVE
ncbi:MAG: cupredoxin domain-containing protein [Candidatus Amesbacteria bacterium]|nr:cupredoxin domain-containing protein [Candidatus Amesbacteria bacterium]